MQKILHASTRWAGDKALVWETTEGHILMKREGGTERIFRLEGKKIKERESGTYLGMDVTEKGEKMILQYSKSK